MSINPHKVDKVKIFDIITNNIPIQIPMDQHTYDNWVKIKATFEASGNTNNTFYRRACEVVKTKKDPLAKFFGDKK